MTNRTPVQRRILAARGQSHLPAEFLQSMLVAELLMPSRRLWLVSPWITDIQVIDNSGRRFGSLDPGWDAGPILLSAYISTYLDRSASIAVVTNFDQHNNRMLRHLEQLTVDHPRRLVIRQLDAIHAKGIVGDHFALTGSMNITYSGVHINSEYLDYTAEPALVHETLAQFEGYLGSGS